MSFRQMVGNEVLEEEMVRAYTRKIMDEYDVNKSGSLDES